MKIPIRGQENERSIISNGPAPFNGTRDAGTAEKEPVPEDSDRGWHLEPLTAT